MCVFMCKIYIGVIPYKNIKQSDFSGIKFGDYQISFFGEGGNDRKRV